MTSGSGGGTKSNNNTVTTDTSDLPTGNEMGDGWILISGMGKFTPDEVEKMVADGYLKEKVLNGQVYYTKA